MLWWVPVTSPVIMYQCIMKSYVSAICIQPYFLMFLCRNFSAPPVSLDPTPAFFTSDLHNSWCSGGSLESGLFDVSKVWWGWRSGYHHFVRWSSMFSILPLETYDISWLLSFIYVISDDKSEVKIKEEPDSNEQPSSEGVQYLPVSPAAQFVNDEASKVNECLCIYRMVPTASVRVLMPLTTLYFWSPRLVWPWNQSILQRMIPNQECQSLGLFLSRCCCLWVSKCFTSSWLFGKWTTHSLLSQVSMAMAGDIIRKAASHIHLNRRWSLLPCFISFCIMTFLHHQPSLFHVAPRTGSRYSLFDYPCRIPTELAAMDIERTLANTLEWDFLTDKYLGEEMIETDDRELKRMLTFHWYHCAAKLFNCDIPALHVL